MEKKLSTINPITTIKLCILTKPLLPSMKFQIFTSSKYATKIIIDAIKEDDRKTIAIRKITCAAKT